MRRTLFIVVSCVLALAVDRAHAWQAILAGTPPDARPFALGVNAAGSVYTGGRTPSGDGFSAGIAARLRAADGAIVWQRTFAGSGVGDHIVRALAVYPGGDAVIIGQLVNEATKADALVVKLAGDGEEVWRREIDGGTNGSDDARAGALLPGGDVIVVGMSPRPGTPGSIAVWKLSGATGASVWTTRLPDAGGVGQRAALAGDGIYVGAEVPVGDGTRLAVSRLGPTGVVVWSVPIAGTGHAGDELTGLAAAAGRVVSCARLAEEGGGSAFVVVALDADTGAEVWRVVLDGAAEGTADLDAAHAVAVDGAGNVVAVGTLSSATSLDDIAVVKLDGGDGHELWRATAAGSDADAEEVRDVAVDAAGDVVVAARLRNAGTNRDMTALKFAGATGALVWSRSIDGTSSGNDTAFNVTVDGAGHVAVAGRLRNGIAGDGYAVARLSGATGGDFPCGNGVPDAGEACDDGNLVAGDGCRVDCTMEVCGDGRHDPQEACDDGVPGAGCCSDACTVEPDGGACDDGDACTEDDQCAGGVCVGAEPVVCPDAGPCRRGVCDPSSGLCSTEDQDDAACDDGDACTGDDRCFDGDCAGGPAVPCDDRDPCTLDGCNPATGCVHDPTTGYPSLLCVFERTTMAVACDDSLPRTVATRLGKTTVQLDRASSAGAPRSECRLLRRGARSARKALRLAARASRRGAVSFDCAEAVAGEMTYLRGGIAQLRAERCASAARHPAAALSAD